MIMFPGDSTTTSQNLRVIAPLTGPKNAAYGTGDGRIRPESQSNIIIHLISYIG